MDTSTISRIIEGEQETTFHLNDSGYIALNRGIR